MYERFTDRARKVLQLTNQEAARFNHEYIGTEHLLLGLVSEGSGIASNVLKSFGIELQNLRIEIEKIIHTSPEHAGQESIPNKPRVKRVIESTIEECHFLNHQYVGTEHLLLGLLREDEGVAALVFQNLGLDRQTIRNEVLSILGHNLDTTASSSDTTNPAELSEPTKLVLQMLPLIPPHERQIVMKKILELE